ncbi:MAG: multiple sugar transport system permease protein [Streptomycetaceae bacterium]|nr:multiple sugar transport system permease protein [Streptomycetaceae bacterium]
MRSRQERAAARGSADTVPIHLYGLRRGTVTVMTLISGAFAAFILAPVLWLVINATKTQANVYGTPGFWFARPFHLFQNLSALGRNVSGAGIYLQWLGNTLLYAGSAAVGATVLSAMAGYGFARFRFRGANGLFYLVMSTLLVPITSVALPLFLVYAKVGLVNSVWGMILPSMVSPVGIYLMRTYIDASVPRDLIDAARMDGASETRIFLRIVLPLTVGLSSLSHAAETGSKAELVPVLIAGGLVTILPLILLFLFLEKYFRGGALQGSTTG